MIVCLCRGVPDRTVRLVVALGAASIADVRAACGAGRGCGACHQEIERLLGDASSPSPSACPGTCGEAIVSAPTAARGTP
jgi:bacterioferritin-associated ferredoxin